MSIYRSTPFMKVVHSEVELHTHINEEEIEKCGCTWIFTKADHLINTF